MALTVYDKIEQHTEEWFAQRRGMITASVVGQLITPSTLKVAANDTSRGLTATLVAERITGFSEEPRSSQDMLRGTLDEPYARDAYAKDRGVDVKEVGFVVRDDWGFEIGWSPDGLVGDDGCLEIKSRAPKTQLRTFLDDEVPAGNMAQIQCALLVSGRAWCDYVSYAGGMHLYIRRVLPDPAWQKAIVAAVTAFEANAVEMTAAYRAATKGCPMTERIDHFAEMEISPWT